MLCNAHFAHCVVNTHYTEKWFQIFQTTFVTLNCGMHLKQKNNFTKWRFWKIKKRHIYMNNKCNHTERPFLNYHKDVSIVAYSRLDIWHTRRTHCYDIKILPYFRTRTSHGLANSLEIKLRPKQNQRNTKLPHKYTSKYKNCPSEPVQVRV